MIILNPANTDCPKCRGRSMAVETDSFGTFIHCLICGFMADVPRRKSTGIRPADVKPADEKSTDKKPAGRKQGGPETPSKGQKEKNANVQAEPSPGASARTTSTHIRLPDMPHPSAPGHAARSTSP